MASLPKEKGKYYRVIFRKVYKTPEGKVKKAKTFYFKKRDYTRTQVKNWMNRKEMEFKGGDWIPWDQPGMPEQGGVSLKEAVEAYLKKAKKVYAKSTYNSREKYLYQFSEDVGPGRSLSSLSGRIVNGWVNQSGLKFPTRKGRKKVLKVFFDWVEKTYHVSPPEIEVEAKQAEKQRYYNKQYKTFVTEDQMRELVNVVENNDLKDFYRLAFYSTRRRSDLLAIRPEWISEDEPLVRIGQQGGYLPKSQMIEYVPLIDEAWKILLGRKDKKPVFDFSPSYVTKKFASAVKDVFPKLSGTLSLHNMRDSGIMYLLYEKNLDVKHVMNMTGHRDIRSLQVYTHPNAKRTLKELQNG